MEFVEEELNCIYNCCLRPRTRSTPAQEIHTVVVWHGVFFYSAHFNSSLPLQSTSQLSPAATEAQKTRALHLPAVYNAARENVDMKATLSYTRSSGSSSIRSLLQVCETVQNKREVTWKVLLRNFARCCYYFFFAALVILCCQRRRAPCLCLHCYFPPLRVF